MEGKSLDITDDLLRQVGKSLDIDEEEIERVIEDEVMDDFCEAIHEIANRYRNFNTDDGDDTGDER